MKQNILIIAVAVIVGIGTAAMVLSSGMLKSEQSLGRTALSENITRNGSTTQFTIGATSQHILSTSSDRFYGQITNDCGDSLWVNFDEDKAATDRNGIGEFASRTYEIDRDNLYQGAVQAITGGATCTVTVTELRKP